MANYDRKDRFFKKAKRDNFVARSIYKLEEIDRRFRLFRQGDRVIDLGCAPGSWLQHLAQAVGPRGLVLGYDLAPVAVSAGPRVHCFEVDVHTLEADEVRSTLELHLGTSDLRPHPVDALLSDMAPKLSGIRDADQARSISLAERALQLASALVHERGVFLAKVFQGRDTDAFVAAVKCAFSDVRILRPLATREGSRELFVLGRRSPPQAK